MYQLVRFAADDPDKALFELRNMVANYRHRRKYENDALAGPYNQGKTLELADQVMSEVEALDSRLKNGRSLPAEWVYTKDSTPARVDDRDWDADWNRMLGILQDFADAERRGYQLIFLETLDNHHEDIVAEILPAGITEYDPDKGLYSDGRTEE